MTNPPSASGGDRDDEEIPIEGVTDRPVWRFGDGARVSDRGRVALEAPLEIRVAGDALATTMRTPGADRFLAVGFLFGEGVIGSMADVGSAAHCGRPGDDSYGNVIDVTPGPGVALSATRLEGSRRGTLTTSSCGICGRRSIDDLLARIPPRATSSAISARVIAEAPEQLAANQPRFGHTGGVHAAAALDAHGRILAHDEDVGRHNAVDKVIGRLLYDGRRPAPLTPWLLVVSGRVSFEIIQKAAVAQFSAVAAISAPTSLAVDLAERAGITLAAFVRNGAFSVYTHPARVDRGSR